MLHADYIEKHGTLSFTVDALKQLAIIQMVDSICGQTDRHFQNMNALINDKGRALISSALTTICAWATKNTEITRPEPAEASQALEWVILSR